jgi:hypothetical protein
MFRLLAAILFATFPVCAEVYKWVDSQGRTQFSDRPQADAVAVDIKTPPADDRADQSAGSGDQGQAPLLGPYAGFEIVSPEPNQTLRQTQQELTVSIILDPPLIGGHQLELVVDGVPISVDKSTVAQIELSGVGLGSHEARAQIRDSRGGIVARTTLVYFDLRKPLPPGVLP